ncbi:hypothetical protein GCK32_001511 [Trichostrongylus colubriformis]|uniref:Uncharacterized protein n=1 Tax=Trichostrongylus colubriformis TaxID=6319 RepID=A0AAN8FTG7_TRICO
MCSYESYDIIGSPLYSFTEQAARQAMHKISRKAFQEHVRKISGVKKMYRTKRKRKSVSSEGHKLWNWTVKRCVTHFTLPASVKESAIALGIRSSFLQGTETISKPIILKEELSIDYDCSSELLVVKEEPMIAPGATFTPKHEQSSEKEISSAATTVKKEEPLERRTQATACDAARQVQLVAVNESDCSSCIKQEELAEEVAAYDAFNDVHEYNGNLLRDIARIIYLHQTIALMKEYLILNVNVILGSALERLIASTWEMLQSMSDAVVECFIMAERTIRLNICNYGNGSHIASFIEGACVFV